MNPRGITAATQGPKGVGWAFGTSLAVHGVALAAIVWGWGSAPVQVGVPIMDVELVVAAPGESGSAASDPAASSAPVAPAGKASTPRESTSAGNQPAPTPTPVAPAEALLAPDVEPPPSTPTMPSDRSGKRETGAPADKGSATTSIPIILPDPEPLPPVRSEDVLHQPTPAPTAEVPPTAPQIPPPAPQPKAAIPAQSPPAEPPRSASPPRPTPPPAPKRTQPDATSAHAPAAPTPRAGSGPTQGTESAGGSPAAGDARLVRHVKPVYPALARERGLEGRVVVRLLIGADGVPAEIRVSHSSGFESLDSAAIDAVRQWRFDPARRAGVAVPEERLAPVVFRLKR